MKFNWHLSRCPQTAPLPSVKLLRAVQNNITGCLKKGFTIDHHGEVSGEIYYRFHLNIDNRCLKFISPNGRCCTTSTGWAISLRHHSASRLEKRSMTNYGRSKVLTCSLCVCVCVCLCVCVCVCVCVCECVCVRASKCEPHAIFIPLIFNASNFLLAESPTL
jgi:hypothetical protein